MQEGGGVDYKRDVVRLPLACTDRVMGKEEKRRKEEEKKRRRRR
jgi:hypothetical protein